jgi:hypothetical protein
LSSPEQAYSRPTENVQSCLQSAGLIVVPVEYDRLWERLIEYINECATAREVPGGIEVTFEQSPSVSRTVEVVVTLAD